MPRPPCCRHVAHLPPHTLFTPAGVPTCSMEVTQLGLDEYEALRLAEVEQLQHEQAATMMGISRQTFGRLLHNAHATVAKALVKGHAINIEGGPVCPPPQPGWCCPKWGLEGPEAPNECRRKLHYPSPRST